MDIIIFRISATVFIAIAFILSVIFMQGLPIPAIGTFRTGILFLLLWSSMESFAFLFIIEEFILKLSVSMFNIGLFLIYIFHEIESIEKWYDSVKLKLMMIIPGVISGLVLIHPDISFTTNGNSKLLVFTPLIGLLQYSFVTVISLLIYRRINQVYRASKYYRKKRSTDLSLYIGLFYAITLPLVLFYQLFTNDLGSVLNFYASIILFTLVFIYSFNPISPVYQQQQIFSLYAISPGGMPTFRYKFSTDPNINIADLMVSGALYSAITMIDDFYQGSNNIKSIDLENRFLTISELNDVKFMLISEYQSKLLEMQLDQLVNDLSQFSLLDKYDELNQDLIPQIFNSIVKIFHTNNQESDMSNLHVYPSFIDKK